MIDSGVVDATQDVLVNWLPDGRRFAQALPRGDEHGAIEGSITGGCVESSVVQESEAILAGRRGPGVLTYGISDELAGTVGLMCGGIVHIFVDELDAEAARIEQAALLAHAQGRPVAIATALDGDAAGA